jgi:hypothetical protein
MGDSVRQGLSLNDYIFSYLQEIAAMGAHEKLKRGIVNEGIVGLIRPDYCVRVV